jgi:DNA-binding transcriptional MerR regulator
MRALYRANLISASGVIEEILIPQLSAISVMDVKDLKHVGKDRLEVLLQELASIEIPAYQPGPEGSGFEKATHYSIEQWVIINILNQVNWRNEFFSSFGYEFDEDIFEDDLVGRKIRVLELRMSGLTLDEIGKLFGVTRERIRQILKKTFKLVEGDPSLGGKGFSEIFAEKTHSAKGKERRLQQERRDSIDSRVRTFLNSKPGATYLEISQELNISNEELRNSLQPQTTKFIWTEASEHVNQSPFSDDDILEALKLAEAFESPISAPMYRELVERGLVHGPGPQTVAIRFGSWKRACELAEVSYNESVRTSYEKLWTESEMLEHVVEFLLNNSFGKGIESYDQWRIETMSNAPSGAHVRKYFQTWIDTKNRALLFMREKKLECNL